MIRLLHLTEHFKWFTVSLSFNRAVFYEEGPVIKMQELETRIVTEWLPTSGYEYANAPEIELYLNPDPDNTKYEIWLPIVRKGEVL